MSGAQPPAIPAFYPGVSAVDQLNVMGAAFTFLRNKVCFRARRAATGTVTKNVHNSVPWDTIDEDPYSGWSAGTPTIYTVQAPGWYLCSGTVSLAGTAAAGTLLIPSLGVNGTSQTGIGGVGWEGPAVALPTGASDPKGASGVWEVYCNTSDQITLDAFTTNEPVTSLTWRTTAGEQTRIEIIWMGV